MYAVAAARPTLKGMIPTAWYPSTHRRERGRRAIWRSVRCSGSAPAKERSADNSARGTSSLRAARCNVVPIPNAAELTGYTTAVSQNNRLALASAPPNEREAPRANVTARAVPERPGEPSLINHVVFIVKENRTFDQVLGDLDRGSHDSSLVDLRPRRHAEHARVGSSDS